MRRFLANRWFKAGVWLVALGWSPLFIIVLLSMVGLWPDPHPNPIGPGLLFFVTAWPAVICLGVGVVQVMVGPGAGANAAASNGGMPVETPVEPLEARLLARASNVYSRIGIGFVGLWLAVHGVAELVHRTGTGGSRGTAAAIVVGGAMLWWGITAHLPEWLRPRRRW